MSIVDRPRHKSSRPRIPTTMTQHYIFGYGSLLCAHSRALTAPPNTATAVVVHGVQRVWGKRTASMTAMGICLQRGASTAGVILPVAETDLPMFDGRERGYARVLLGLDHVDVVPDLGDAYYTENEHHQVFWKAKKGNNKHDTIQVWAYFPNTLTPADSQHPIVQSYVDTILRGCLAVGGEELAQEFIQTTQGWDPEELQNLGSNDQTTPLEATWVDDRANPMYTRGDPVHSRTHASQFDSLLQTFVPKAFERRRPIPSTTKGSV